MRRLLLSVVYQKQSYSRGARPFTLPGTSKQLFTCTCNCTICPKKDHALATILDSKDSVGDKHFLAPDW